MDQAELERKVREYLKRKYPQAGVGKIERPGKAWKWHCGLNRRVHFEVKVNNPSGQLAGIDLYACPKCGDVAEGELSGWARRVLGLPKK